MKPKVKVLIVRPELPQKDLEKLLEVRKWFQDKVNIDLAFHRKEYESYGWSTPYANSGNRTTAKWKRDNLVFDTDITVICIPKEKWLRKNAGGYSADHEQKELIILKDTDNLDWLVYAIIHELCHTFIDLTGQEDKTHDYDTGSKGAKGLKDLEPMLKYIRWDLI
jgi:hypothetical protein